MANAGGADAKATYPLSRWDTEEEQEEKVSNSFSLGADEEADSLTESPQKLPTHTQLVKDYVTPSMMNGESQNSGPCSTSLSVCPQCVCVRMYNDGKEAEIIDGPQSGSFVRGGSVGMSACIRTGHSRI